MVSFAHVNTITLHPIVSRGALIDSLSFSLVLFLVQKWLRVCGGVGVACWGNQWARNGCPRGESRPGSEKMKCCYYPNLDRPRLDFGSVCISQWRIWNFWREFYTIGDFLLLRVVRFGVNWNIHALESILIEKCQEHCLIILDRDHMTSTNATSRV